MEEIEKTAKACEPDVGHSPAVARPERLDLMALEDRDKEEEATAENRRVELGGRKALGDIHASEPRKDEEPERFEFETGQALRRNQSGLGGIVAKTRNAVIDMERSRLTGARIESILHGPRRR